MTASEFSTPQSWDSDRRGQCAGLPPTLSDSFLLMPILVAPTIHPQLILAPLAYLVAYVISVPIPLLRDSG